MQIATFHFSRQAFRAGYLGLALSLVPSGWSASSTVPSPSALLRAELPPDVAVGKAPCDLLVRALHRAVLAHRSQSSALLTVALTGDQPAGRSKLDLPCACTRQLFHAAASADPGHASLLLEQAVSLRPACADELQREAQELNDKNVVNDFKDAAADPASRRKSEGFDPSFRDGLVPVADPGNAPTGFDTPGDLYGGFGVGFGPGFPGSPGFTGSTPSGAIALPPSPTAVTNVVNN